MPDQTFNLNIKAHDQGWEGKQSQLWTCAECAAQSNNPGGHSGWHDALNNTLQQAIDLANQGIQAAAQAQQTAQQALTLAQQAMAKP